MLVSTLSSSVKKIHIDVVTTSQIESIDTLLSEKFRPFTGTMKMHQYTWSKENSGLILFNSLSCLGCQPGVICEHFSMGQINYNDIRIQNNKMLKRSLKDTEVSIKIKKPKITPNVTLRRSLRNIK